MAARPVWKGSIKLSLITIPIRVFPATDASADVSFRQLHRTCHTPIQLKKWCPHCEQEVAPDDIVKGYESSKGRYAVVTEEEIARLRPEATHIVDIANVIDRDAIDPLYIERAYFLAPDTKAAGASFAVLRDAFGTQAGVGRLALHGREYLVAVLPRDHALVLYTLRTAGEVRDMRGLDTLEFADVRTKPEEVKLARQVLGAFDKKATLAAFTDRYEDALRAMLARKTSEEAVTEHGGATKGPVNLMDALRRSLNTVRTQKRTPPKTRARRPARVIAHPSSHGRRRAS